MQMKKMETIGGLWHSVVEKNVTKKNNILFSSKVHLVILEWMVSQDFQVCLDRGVSMVIQVLQACLVWKDYLDSLENQAKKVCQVMQVGKAILSKSDNFFLILFLHFIGIKYLFRYCA